MCIMVENERLAALYGMEILSGPPEPALDQIVKMARLELGAQHAGIMIVDRTTATFVASENIKVKVYPRNNTFCNLAIKGNAPLIIRDAVNDPRTKFLPLAASGVRSYVGVPLTTHAGYNIGTLCVFGTEELDITPEKVCKLQELARLAMYCVELRQLATRDHLTGALNRRGFMSELDCALHRLSPDTSDLALVIMDLDHFKTVNDRFGHATGDLVLQAVVLLAKQECNGISVIGRLGGEEFGILLPGLDEAAAFPIIERLRQRIEAIQVPNVPMLRVTASFGIAEADDFMVGASTLMAKADAALYKAKAGSRNMTVVARGKMGEVKHLAEVRSLFESAA